MLTKMYQRALINKLLYVMDAENATPGKHFPCLGIKKKQINL